MPNLPCRLPQSRQISTGQAGAEINRDLEVLFADVNALKLCASRQANYLNANGGGAFDTGGTGGGGDEGGGGTHTDGTLAPGGGSPPSAHIPHYYVETATDWTLPECAYGVWNFVPTANLVVTLPSPIGCGFVIVVNGASATYSITLKDDLGSTIATLAPTEAKIAVTRMDASGGYWPSVVTTV